MMKEVTHYLTATRECDKQKYNAETWAEAQERYPDDPLGAKYCYIHLRVEQLMGRELDSSSPGKIESIPKAKKPSVTKAKRDIAEPPSSREHVDEDALYELVAREFDGAMRNEETWREAQILARGQFRAAKAHYICLRIESLKAAAADARCG